MAFGHVNVGNKSLRETIPEFDLEGHPKSPMVVSINTKREFDREGIQIRIPIMEILICADVIKLVHSKKQHNWVPLNSVLLPPFLTKAVNLDGKQPMVYILKLFSYKILENWTEIS